MNIKDFNKLLYPHGQSTPQYLNMVGIDHLILSSPAYAKEIKNACKNALNDKEFDIEILPYNDLVEYQICYFVIGVCQKKTFQEQLQFIYENSSKAKSWMVTDTCNQYYKKLDYSTFKPYFLKFLHLNGVYQRRFAYVIGLKFAKNEEACELFLNNILDDDRYYVLMSEAWLIAELGIYHFSKVKKFLISAPVSVMLKKKAISKMIDSYRITNEQKDTLKEIRKTLS